MASGHGGRRPGSGRKPKDALLRAIDGGAGRRPVLTGGQTANSSTAVAEVEEFDAADDLPEDAKRVWLKLAPLAFKRRTLTRSSAYAFELLCRNVVLERAYSDSVLDRGSSNHRGLIQRIDAELLAFDLRPCGKPMYEAAGQATPQPANPLSRFLKRSS